MKCMANNLRCSAAEESEDTLNAFTSPTNSQEVARPQNFIMGNEETELELSVESRSFVNRVNDQVRKRQKNFPTMQEMEKNIL